MLVAEKMHHQAPKVHLNFTMELHKLALIHGIVPGERKQIHLRGQLQVHSHL
jgi:hypothetical protein